jgi:uncharacterized membrane-anchored protein
MTETQTIPRSRRLSTELLNKVPEVTIYFWVIKILCTTVGETAADYLNAQLGLGLTNTSLVMGSLLVLALAVQFRTRRYTPSVYWITVVLISVVGTLITDNLTDNFGVPLPTSTVIFAVLLAITFGLWFRSEGTLSIHTIFTPRREAWYWSAILFTFALGTAAGDLVAEHYGVGYLQSAFIFGAVIALVWAAHTGLRLNAVLAFWIAYILTRPLGASIGDYMSQPNADGGLGLGSTGTSALFLGAIVVLVAYLSLTRVDAIDEPHDTSELVSH